MPDFLLPDLGEGLDEAEVIAWQVRVGDIVNVDQIVVEVETAKAAVEVPVPFAGTVTKLHATPGTTIRVGQPLITIAPAVQRISSDAETSGNVLIGFGTGSATGTAWHRSRRSGRNGGRVVHTTASTSAVAVGRAIPVISPLVRKLARDADLDLTTIIGTGPSGTIRRHDVEEAVQANEVEPNADKPDTSGETRIPLRGLRRTMADKVTQSRREIPEATVWVDVDATELFAARAVLNTYAPDQPVGLLALIARFTILALRRHPELNARLEDDEIVVPDHVHLGFAAQTGRGLVVPVIPDAHRMSARELSAAIASRTAAARAGNLAPAQLIGSTITVNNYGVFGVDGSAAIINHPEVAMVGVGRIIDRPWVVDGQLTVRKVGELTLAFDHRVCDGGTAGGFLRALADHIEKPITALGES